MASNKYLIEDRSILLQKKLESLSEKLQGAFNAGQFETQEEYIFEAVKIVSSFYQSLLEPQLQIDPLHVDNLPDSEVYNKLWQQLLSDLTIIFQELENAEDMTLANFNYMVTESNRLTSRLKSVFSKLGDYILYSSNSLKDAIYFKDSFNDLSKVVVKSILLNAEECEVDQTQGIVTLPIDREQDSGVLVTGGIVFNSNSNGTAGNNQQLNAPWNGNTNTLLDNNADTWFEYEKVVTSVTNNKEALVLDITLNLGEPRIINYIRINPNNFGTKTVIQIDAIDTSTDGQVYTSIKDDIPIAGFTTEDEANIFNLAPSTSKYAGQGIYTFTPRKVKYIHFIFKQSEPYIIDTPSGQKLRYAIGIRDIDIRAYKFKNKGELVSKSFESQDEIRKVLLQTNQNPSAESELAIIEYFLSPDDGSTWSQIQPKDFTGLSRTVSVPEILEYNGASVNTITTPVPVNKLQMKCVLKRIDENFVEGSSSFNKVKIVKSELQTVPSTSPYTITLEEAPVDGSVQVIDPMFGSRGDPKSPYIIGHYSLNRDQSKYRLPFERFPRPIEKIETTENKYHIAEKAAGSFMHVEVGGKEWSHATSPISEETADWTGGDVKYVYTFNVNTGELEFGNNTNTAAPPSDAPITLYFDEERIYPSSISDDHLAKLDFFTSTSKSDLTVKRYDEILSATEILSRNATVIRLSHKYLTEISGIEAKLGVGNKRTFINGRDELLSIDDWSIDEDEGIIYKYTPTSDTSDVTVNYRYQPIVELSENDWEWGTSNKLRDSISIKESEWKTITVSDLPIYVEPGSKIIDLAHLSILKGSLKFSLAGTDANDSNYNPFMKEVDFIDGRTEFSKNTIKTVEKVPSLNAGLNTIYFTENIAESTDLETLFSDSTLFITEVFSEIAVTENGKYYIDRENDYYQVWLDSPATSTGTVTYYYPNPNIIDNGLFSVNYKRGTVHTQRAIDPDLVGDWELTVDYDYSDFRVIYRIARLLDPKTYSVDITNRTITFKDSEILRRSLLPKEIADGKDPEYLVNYEYVGETRENVQELKDFFSPVIKDYALKVITKNRIL